MSSSAVATVPTNNMQPSAAPATQASNNMGKQMADRDQLWSELRDICERLRPPVQPTKPFNAYSLLKQLQNDYFPRIVESKHWRHVLMHYSMLARAYSHLRDDLHYQVSGILLLAHYINHNCEELLRTAPDAADPDRTEIYRRFDGVCDLMNEILFDSVEHKVLVMLRTKMCEQNAFFLVLLCKRIYADIVDRVVQPCADQRQSAIVLLNGVVLLLTRWYQMQRTDADRAKFHVEMELLVKRLEKLRTAEQVLANGEQFYAQFGHDYRTVEITALYTRNIDHAVIANFFQSYVTYWRSRTPAVLVAERLRKASLLDNGVVEIVDDDDADSSALIILDDDDETGASTPVEAPSAPVSNNTAVVVLSDSEDEDTGPASTPPVAATKATSSAMPASPAISFATPSTTQKTATASASLEKLTSRLSITCAALSTTQPDTTRTTPATKSAALETPTANPAIMPSTISATNQTTSSAPSGHSFTTQATSSAAPAKCVSKTATSATRDRETATPNMSSATAETAEVPRSTPTYELNMKPAHTIIEPTPAKSSIIAVLDSNLAAEPAKPCVQAETVQPTFSSSNASHVHEAATATTTTTTETVDTDSLVHIAAVVPIAPPSSDGDNVDNCANVTLAPEAAPAKTTTSLSSGNSDSTTVSCASESLANCATVVPKETIMLDAECIQLTTKESRELVNAATVLTNETTVLEATSTQPTTSVSSVKVGSACNPNIVTYSANDRVAHLMLNKTPLLETAIVQTATATAPSTTCVTSNNNDLAMVATIVSSFSPTLEEITEEIANDSDSIANDKSATFVPNVTTSPEAAIVQPIRKVSNNMICVANDMAAVSIANKTAKVTSKVSPVYKTATIQPTTFAANDNVSGPSEAKTSGSSHNVVIARTVNNMSNATTVLEAASVQAPRIDTRADKISARKSMSVLSGQIDTKNLVGAIPMVIKDSAAPSIPANVTVTPKLPKANDSSAPSKSSIRAKSTARKDILTRVRAKSNAESSITDQLPTPIRKARSKSSKSALPSATTNQSSKNQIEMKGSSSRTSQAVHKTENCDKTNTETTHDSPASICGDKFYSTSSNDSDSALAFPVSQSKSTDTSKSTLAFRSETITPPTPAVPKSLIIINPTDTVAVAQLTKSNPMSTYVQSASTTGMESSMCDTDSNSGEMSIISDSHPSEKSSSSSVYSAKSITSSIPNAPISTSSHTTGIEQTPTQKSASASGDEDMVDNDSQSSSCDNWSSMSLFGEETSGSTSTSMPEAPSETPEPVASIPAAKDAPNPTTLENDHIKRDDIRQKDSVSGQSDNEHEATKSLSALHATDSLTMNATPASASPDSKKSHSSLPVPPEVSMEIPVSELKATIMLNIDDAEQLNSHIHLLSKAEQPLSQMFVRDPRISENVASTMLTSLSVPSSSSDVPNLVKNQKYPKAKTHAATPIISNSAANTTSTSETHNPSSIIMSVRIPTTAHPDFQRLPETSSSELTTLDALNSVGENMSPCSPEQVLSAGSSPASSVTSWSSTSASSSASSTSSSSFSSSSSLSASPMSSTVDETLPLQADADATFDNHPKRPKMLEITSPGVPVAVPKRSSKKKRRSNSRITSHSTAKKLQITDITSTTQSDSLPSPELPLPPTAADSPIFRLQPADQQSTDQLITGTSSAFSSSSASLSTLNYPPANCGGAVAPENSNGSGRCGTPLIDEHPSAVPTEFYQPLPHKPTAIYGRVQTQTMPLMPLVHNGYSSGLLMNTAPTQFSNSIGNYPLQHQLANVAIAPGALKMEHPKMQPTANHLNANLNKRKQLDTSTLHSMNVLSKKPRSEGWADEINLFTTHFSVLPHTRNRILEILTDSVPKTASGLTLKKLILAEIFFVQSVMHAFRTEVPNPVNDLDEWLRRTEESNYGWDTLTIALQLYNEMKIAYSAKHNRLNNILNHTDMFLKRWKEIRRSMFRMEGSDDVLNRRGPSRSDGPGLEGQSDRLTGWVNYHHGAGNNGGGMQGDMGGGGYTDDMNLLYVQDHHHLHHRLPLVEDYNLFDSMVSYKEKNDFLNTVKSNAHALVKRSQEL